MLYYSTNRICGQPGVVIFLDPTSKIFHHKSFCRPIITGASQMCSSMSTSHLGYKVINRFQYSHIIQLLLRAEYMRSNLRSNASTCVLLVGLCDKMYCSSLVP